ncbi:hypothetical protein ANO11243_048230 [Dothideomycetidae sp. 11243]|nr:hypothetical protein ANO11243_048230 [fungal sp. No.11243]
MTDTAGSGIQVAYLGPEASYTHQAALSSFASEKHELIACPSIASVFTSVRSGKTEYGIVPFENSSNGAVLPTLDLLAGLITQQPALEITSEAFVDVHHSLLARPNADGSDPPLSSIKTLYSHPQAWGQCGLFLDARLPNAEHLDVGSTSAAAARVAASAPGSGEAAIASALAGQVYGLCTLRSSIEDRPDNQTRFLVLRQRRQRGDDHVNAVKGTTTTKTLLHFRVPVHEHPGALADALAVFKHRGLTLTSMYTRPDPAAQVVAGTARWRYIFFVEFQTNVGDGHEDRGAEALEELAAVTRDLTVCGTWSSR